MRLPNENADPFEMERLIDERFVDHCVAEFDRVHAMFVAVHVERRLPCSLHRGVAVPAIHGDLFHPVWYVPFVGHYALLAAIGLIAHRRGYDRFFAWYQLITLLIWALLVRRYLVPDTMAA